MNSITDVTIFRKILCTGRECGLGGNALSLPPSTQPPIYSLRQDELPKTHKGDHEYDRQSEGNATGGTGKIQYKCPSHTSRRYLARLWTGGGGRGKRTNEREGKREEQATPLLTFHVYLRPLHRNVCEYRMEIYSIVPALFGNGQITRPAPVPTPWQYFIHPSRHGDKIHTHTESGSQQNHTR